MITPAISVLSAVEGLAVATPLFQPDARIATVETTDGLTVFTRLGDWIGWLSAAGSAFLLLALWWRGRREARRETSEGGSA
jgi:K+ transporter